MEEWSISCNTDIDVDFSVFDVWLQGKIESVVFEQVFDNRMKTKWGDAIICSHIHDQFSLFQFLKHYFEHPWNFEVLRYQLDSPTRNRLINAYYSFNYCFARDLLNHRISSKLRKDVDEIADKFRLSELVCLRYFDNFRLVLNKVEDYDKANIVDHIKNTFMMSDELAKSYGTVVFLQNFKIDVSRKKMQFLTFNDLIFLCTNIIANWCSSNNEDGDLLDREFFNRLHECKSIDSEVIGAISDLVLDKSGLPVELKDVSRGIVKEVFNAATHLKDVKELIHNMVKISDPSCNLSSDQFEAILKALSAITWNQHIESSTSKDISKVSDKDWNRFIQCTKLCCQRVFAGSW